MFNKPTISQNWWFPQFEILEMKTTYISQKSIDTITGKKQYVLKFFVSFTKLSEYQVTYTCIGTYKALCSSKNIIYSRFPCFDHHQVWLENGNIGVYHALYMIYIYIYINRNKLFIIIQIIYYLLFIVWEILYYTTHHITLSYMKVIMAPNISF